MAKMKALRFERFGPPSVLSVQSVDVPVPADGEVLVEVRASGVNPSDLKDCCRAFQRLAASHARTRFRRRCGRWTRRDRKTGLGERRGIRH